MSANLIVLALGNGVNYSRFTILDFSYESCVLNCYRIKGWVGSPAGGYHITLIAIDTTHPHPNLPPSRGKGFVLSPFTGES